MKNDLIKEGEIIYNIPDSKAYYDLYDIFESLGYSIYSHSEFSKWPNLTLSSGQICGNSSVFGIEKSRKFTTYDEFMSRLGRDAENKNWREELSNLFNKKVRDGI